MKFAVQLYSLRELAAREGGEAVLRTVAEAGYDGVEFAGFYGLSPEQMRALLAKYRLEAVSAHIGTAAVEESLPYIDALGIRSVVIPWRPVEDFDDPERYAAFLREIERLHALLAPRGVRLGYHNHAHEYSGGKERFAKLLADAPCLGAEPDVFWLHVAGKDPVAELHAMEKRLMFVHIKEAAASDPVHTPEPFVGEGAVNMRGVFSAVKEAGLPWVVLEAEHFACSEGEYLSHSLKNMKRLAGQE